MATQWTEKFEREYPFMPFGSMMNAYGNINKGKGITLKKFLGDADEIFNKSVEIIQERIANEELKKEKEDKKGIMKPWEKSSLNDDKAMQDGQDEIDKIKMGERV